MDLNKIIKDKVLEILKTQPLQLDPTVVSEAISNELSKRNFDLNKLVTVDGFQTYINNLQQTINTITSDLAQRASKSEELLNEKLKALEDNTPLGGDNPISPKVIVTTPLPDGSPDQGITINAQHREFENLLNFINDNIPVYIHGPTGSGKTTAVYTAGRALSLNVYRKVLSRETQQHEIFGYMDATGKYVKGIAFDPFVDGGILLLDEVDNGNPNTNTAVKMLNDTDECFFPCGLKPKHKDFRIVANANTIGNGATSQYVGRNQQDKAFLNIFSFLQWDYDEDFENEIAWAEYIKVGGDPQRKKVFDKIIKSMRDYRYIIMELEINHIISPRNILQAVRMFARGRDLNLIKESVIWRGLDSGAREKIDSRIKAHNNLGGGRPKIEAIWNNV